MPLGPIAPYIAHGRPCASTEHGDNCDSSALSSFDANPHGSQRERGGAVAERAADLYRLSLARTPISCIRDHSSVATEPYHLRSFSPCSVQNVPETARSSALCTSAAEYAAGAVQTFYATIWCFYISCEIDQLRHGASHLFSSLTSKLIRAVVYADGIVHSGVLAGYPCETHGIGDRIARRPPGSHSEATVYFRTRGASGQWGSGGCQEASARLLMKVAGGTLAY